MKYSLSIKSGFFLIGLIGFVSQVSAQFTLLNAKESGISFVNKLTETESKNVLAYEYFYNGGGVAAGDLNNDGLIDLYFTGNMVQDKIYLNLGHLQFKDITQQAGIEKATGWKTGVTLVDINKDGWLDIYVCYSGDGDQNSRRNKLYINNKNLTFTEKAAVYGLDSPSNSTQAAFFDYDKDGDLDCFLLNHSIKDYKRFDASAMKAMRDEFAGDKLLKNENGVFIDVSAAAGIKGNPLGFGLGIAVSDINHDGWPDIYISNDYLEQDYLYINNGNGTFSDKLEESVGHLSYFSMGNEVVDINNDGLADIFTLDMLPEDNHRQKLLYGPENYENYKTVVQNGFYHQIMRNMVQLNNGNGTFSEIGQLMGVSNTDWSWSPLVADFDNDGWKDLYITNGYLRDYTNMDFMKFYADKELKAAQGNPTAMMDILKEMPSTATRNYIFRNNGNLGFENKVKEWGFDQLFLSNGAVYADLDNDGDLEIITNNVNTEASVYRNDSPKTRNFLQVKLGENNPAEAIGAKVWLFNKGKQQYREFYPTRGFQSAMYIPLHFGTGDDKMMDSLKVIWSDNKTEVLYKIATNQTITLHHKDALKLWTPTALKVPFFTTATKDTLPYSNVEDDYNDFKRQLLMPNMISYSGPRMAKGDINGDGLLDLYIGGSKGQSGALLIQEKDGSWKGTEQPAIDSDIMSTDTDALFFDADKDGDLDLYVVSGGFSYLPDDLLLQDRLYLNDGTGKFSKTEDNLPGDLSSDSCVTPIDIDNDGDLDLFVGGRVIPGNYPLAASSRILINNGKGIFTEGNAQIAPFLEKFGMVTDAVTLDVNKDGWQDLVIAGEWMPVTVLLNHQGKLTRTSALPDSNGWWSRIALEDLDNDGDQDIILGNYGQNTQMKPSGTEPVSMIYGDFDQNEAIDPFLTYYVQGKAYPLVSRDEALNQVFSLRRKFTSYLSYADASMKEILTPEQFKMADTLIAETFASAVLENKGGGTFINHPLPIEAQFAPVFGIALLDVNHDGLKDLVLGGNQTYTRIKIGKMDANYGMLFLNKGKFSFEYVPQSLSGFNIRGDVRDIVVIPRQGETRIYFGRNNKSVAEYILKK